MRKIWMILPAVLILGCSDDEKEVSTEYPPDPLTEIPDARFEAALVNLGYDDTVDGNVRTSAIAFVEDLNLDNREIENLSGIEDFKELVNLSVRGNNLENLDLSANTSLLFIWAENNAITSLSIGQNTEIEKIGLSGNQLESISLSTYTRLQLLTLANNQISRLDVSAFPDLNTMAAEGNPLNCIQVSAVQLDNIPGNWSKDATAEYSEDCP
ncbi:MULTISPECIES: hypothetical protein [Robiginitalea]|nr:MULTISPECIES: hypothetical protein [Robiginitalea]MDC6354678.1 hypothetical protein [Robiginitalea sp. PM2]MDC6374640.1 hypothetical protein [Robiginitalea sp. SP8]